MKNRIFQDWTAAEAKWYLDLTETCLAAPVCGSEVDPVSGVRFDVATGEALAQLGDYPFCFCTGPFSCEEADT